MKPIIGYELDGGKAVRIDLSSLIESRLLIQANSGGGKSHTIRALLELTHGHVQQIVIDPEGEFSTLREKFDYVYAAPKGGDCLATPQTAELLARRVMELRCNIIIDIYELKHYEKMLFIKRFLDALINLPKELWHECVVVRDEAHKYAPESGKGKAESLPAVIDLASLGRKRGYCAWIATQRAAKLSKDVTAELNNQIIGRARIKEDRKRNAEELGITDKEEIARLGQLDKGEFFVQGPAISGELSLVKIVDVTTSHPKIGKKAGKAPAPSAKVKKILAELEDLPKEAEEEAKTVEALRGQVAELKRQLRAAPKVIEKPVGRVPKMVVKAPVDRKVAREQATAIGRFVAAFGRLASLIRQAGAAATVPQVDELNNVGDWILKLATAEAHKDVVPIFPVPGVESIGRSVRVPAPRSRSVENPQERGSNRAANGDHANIGKGEKRTLIAIAQAGDTGLEPDQLSVLTGYRRSSRDAFLSRLRKAGFITDGVPLVATDAGIAALGNAYEPLPTGDALQRYWMGRLPEGEKKCLSILIEAYPNAVACEEIDERTGYRRSSRDAFLSRLSSRRLITKPNRGAAKAAPTLFD